MTRARAGLCLFLLSIAAFGQQMPGPPPEPPKPAAPAAPVEEPPEEDASFKPKEYAFNPLQAEKEMRAGEFYMKKGNYHAAAKRFEEATKWNPTSADAYLRLGEAAEKANDRKTAHGAYAKYLSLAPDSKHASAIKKKLGKS